MGEGRRGEGRNGMEMKPARESAVGGGGWEGGRRGEWRWGAGERGVRGEVGGEVGGARGGDQENTMVNGNED